MKWSMLRSMIFNSDNGHTNLTNNGSHRSDDVHDDDGMVTGRHGGPRPLQPRAQQHASVPTTTYDANRSYSTQNRLKNYKGRSLGENDTPNDDNYSDIEIGTSTVDRQGIYCQSIDHLHKSSNDDVPTLQHRRKLKKGTTTRTRVAIQHLNSDDVDYEYDTSSYTGSSSTSGSNDSIQSLHMNDNNNNNNINATVRSTNDVSVPAVTHSISWLQQMSTLHQQLLRQWHHVTVTRWTNIRGHLPQFSFHPAPQQRHGRPTNCISLPVTTTNNNNNNHTNNNSNKINTCHITFRKIHPTDKKQVQQLHEQWFPVRYLDEFYDDLVYERMSTTGDPLFTCVGTIPVRMSHSLSSSSSSSSLVDNDDEPEEEQEPEDDYDRNLPQISSSSPISDGLELLHPQQQEQIVACVVGCFIQATTLSGQLQTLLITNIQNHTRLFYIMTVGTTIRNHGIGTMLIEKCIQQVLQDQSCGVLYLHVLTTNVAAIQMYEQLGFHRVIEIPNYYTINSIRHNCYLYAKYYHGNRGHLMSSSSILHSYWTTVRDYCFHLPGVWNNAIAQYFFPTEDHESIIGDGINIQ